MGAASTKFVSLKMPFRSKSRSRKHHKTKNKTKLAATDTTKATGDQGKPDPYALPTTPRPPRKPRVWVVNLDDNDVLSTFPSEYLRRRRDTAEDVRDMQSLAADFEEFDVLTENYPVPDPKTLAKNRKFIIAWKAGLSYRLTKLGTNSTDIPVVATAFCKMHRSKWHKCCRPAICHSKHEEEADVESYQQHIAAEHATHNVKRNVHGMVLFNEQRQEREKRMMMAFPKRGSIDSNIYQPENPLGSMSSSFHRQSISSNGPSPVKVDFIQEKRASLIFKRMSLIFTENEMPKRNYSDSLLVKKNAVQIKTELGGLKH